MKIRELYIRNFGKFSNKRILFKDGINIFYGENETGKTTIHTFIKCMLFGLERGRGRASQHDTFSKYEPWENPNYYSGVLRFESGGKQFCLTRNFDRYSKSASLICEDDGEQFSLEHGDLEMLLGGMDASDYENTVSVGQMRSEPNQNLGVALQNYATNYYYTGNSEIQLEAAIQHLKQRKRETEKAIQETIQSREQKRQELEQAKAYNARELSYVGQELESVEVEIDRGQKEQREVQSQEGKHWRVHPGEFLFVLMLVSGICFLLERPFSYLIAIVAILGECIFVWNRLKEGKEQSQEEVLKEMQLSLQKLYWRREELQEQQKEKRTLQHNLLETLQELDECCDSRRQLECTKNGIVLAIQRLQELSGDVHKELASRLNEKTSEILNWITDGKYKMLLLDEQFKISLFNGERKIPLEQVSRGTVEQVYFALRMAASDILHEEEYPVVLDDTFVYYDDVRLERTLRWLLENRKQVLLFTCQKREQDILEKIKKGVGN